MICNTRFWIDERGKQHVRNSAEDPRLGLTCTEACAESQITKNSGVQERVYFETQMSPFNAIRFRQLFKRIAGATINATSMSTIHPERNPWSVGDYTTPNQCHLNEWDVFCGCSKRNSPR